MEIVHSPEAPNELNDALPWLIMGIINKNKINSI
jgi:hypothetical protein